MPSPSLTDLLTWAQYFLSLAGLVAIGKFLFDWISNYANKQRELRELDKEVRTAQRELIDGQKALREMYKELLTKQLNLLQEQIQIAEKEAESTSLTVRQLQKRNAILDASDRYLRRLWETVANTELPNAETSFEKGIESLVDSLAYGDPKQKALFHQFRAGLAQEPAPQNPSLQPAYWMGLMQSVIGHLRLTLGIATSVVPFLVEGYDKNPDQPIKELFLSFADSQRTKADQLRATADAIRTEAQHLEKLQLQTDTILEIVAEARKFTRGSQEAQNLLLQAGGMLTEAQETIKLLPGNPDAQNLLSATEASLVAAQEIQRVPQPPARSASGSSTSPIEK